MLQHFLSRGKCLPGAEQVRHQQIQIADECHWQRITHNRCPEFVSSHCCGGRRWRVVVRFKFSSERICVEGNQGSPSSDRCWWRGSCVPVGGGHFELGRASCRERVWQYG